MVVCIIALVVLAFMSIFSAKYRPYVKEAAGCVGRMITLRPCQMQFDDKVRAKLTAKISTRSTKIAGFIYRNFKIMSWILVIVFFISIAYTIYGAYNYAVYGTCDPVNDEFCVYGSIEGALYGEECEIPGCGEAGCSINQTHISGTEDCGEFCNCTTGECSE